MSNKKLLVAAISARPYAEAAVRSGFSVSVIDAFADQEVSALADQVITVPFDNIGFNPDGLLDAIHRLAKESFLGCIYGSGFEAQPALLKTLTDNFPLLGNTPQVLRQVKNKENFFSALDLCSIAYPSVLNNVPQDYCQALLVKSITGCGGQHIHYVDDKTTLKPDEYLQVYLEGESISVLFLAENTGEESLAHIIGFNTQWLAPSESQPFRFGGIASQAELTNACKNQLSEIVNKLSTHFQLVGLNSLDVVIRNEEIFVLEINPRLSASVELYAQDCLDCCIDLIGLHVACCKGKPLAASVRSQLGKLCQQIKSARALQVLYAEKDMTISATNDWPDWVKDRPFIKTPDELNYVNLVKEMPICTVNSQGKSVLSAKSILKTRVNWMRSKF